MTNELTLNLLDEAIAKIAVRETEREIIGFKIHPEDLRDLKNKLAYVWVRTNNKLMVAPPYDGLIIQKDPTVPRGKIEAIRKRKGVNNDMPAYR